MKKIDWYDLAVAVVTMMFSVLLFGAGVAIIISSLSELKTYSRFSDFLFTGGMILIGLILLILGVIGFCPSLSNLKEALHSGEKRRFKDRSAKKQKNKNQKTAKGLPLDFIKRKKRAEAQFSDFTEYLEYAISEIKDEEVTARLKRIKLLTEDIFDNRELNNANMRLINKFNSYYIPTTIKLVDTYISLDSGTVKLKGEEELKESIKDSLAHLVNGFEKLNENMLLPTKMDVEAEIEALKTVLVLDGLDEKVPKRNFERKAQKNK